MMPTGYDPNNPSKWWEEIGKYTTPGTSTYDPNFGQTPVIPPEETPPIDPSTLYPDVVDPNSEWAKYIQSLMDTTKGGYQGIDQSKLMLNLPGYEKVAAPDVIPYQTAEYGPTANLPGMVDYGGMVTPGQVDYRSGFNPQLAQQQAAQAMKGIQAQALPGLQEQLAGGREAAARASGEGGGTGQFAEFGRQPLEKFGQQMAQEAGKLQQNIMAQQAQDLQRRAEHEMQQQGRVSDATFQQMREAQSFVRDQKVQQEQLKFEQDMSKKAFDREQRATALSKDFAQKLTNAEWDRNQQMKAQEWELDKQMQEGTMNAQAYLTAWTSANNERMQNLEYTRKSLETELQIALDSNNFEREKAVRIELANIAAESAQAQADAQEKSSMWGGIAGLAGTVVGAKIIAMVCFADTTEVLVSKKISELQDGDMVVGKQPDGKLVKNKVTKLLKYENANLKQRINGNLELTDHPFITDKGAVKLVSEIDEPTIGLTKPIEIKTEKIERKGTVYNLDLDGNFTYFVKNGDDYSLVHNGRAKVI